MLYAIVNKATRQPLGIVSANDERSLFEGVAALSDESGIPLQDLKAVNFETPAVMPDPEEPASITNVGAG